MFARFIDIDRCIHSLKTAIACIIGLLLTKVIGFQADQWVVVTIAVVMCAQIYVGSVLQKAYLRFIGTLTGCLFAAIAIILAAPNINLTVVLITIALSSLIFSYIAAGQETFSYAGTLGAVTTIIIMINPQPDIYAAGTRFIEISVGILIAAFVSQFVLPIHARTHLQRTQAVTLTQLRDYYIATIINRQIKDSFPQEDLDEDIVKSLSKQRQLAKEAAHEPIGLFYDSKLFVQLLRCEKELLRSMVFMFNALTHIKNINEVISQSSAFHLFNQTVIQFLNLLIKSTKTDAAPLALSLHSSLAALKEDIQKKMPATTHEELVYIDGFLFSAETLIRSLTTLMELYRAPSAATSIPVKNME